jgi:hypothetical protein
MRALQTNTANYQTQTPNIYFGNINTEKQFELAIETANAGYKLKAMEMAREALIFAKQNNEYLAVYIHSFLAVISLDFMKYSNARIHIYNAMHGLDKNHFSYNTDKEYMETLLKAIEKAETGHKQLTFEELAA